MFTGPVGPVEVFFYWPENVFGNFYWPGAIGSPLPSSPGFDHSFLLFKYKSIVDVGIKKLFVFFNPTITSF